MKQAPILILALSISLVFPGCGGSRQGNSHRDMDFNNGWKFIEKDIPEAMNIQYNDSSWRAVDLPHDWSVEDYPVQDEYHHGPFLKSMEKGHDAGYLRGGTGWYRKKLNVEKSQAGKRFILYFDGIQSEATIFINGEKAAEHKYGYTAFFVDITPYLNGSGQENLIAIKVFKPEQNSRWFTGAGIFRQVTLSILPSLYIPTWGTSVEAMLKGTDTSFLKITADVKNSGGKPADFLLKAEILSPEGDILIAPEEKARVGNGDKVTIEFKQMIVKPRLWNTDSPDLYKVRISLIKKNKVIDHASQSFGIRSLEYSSEKGLVLNGEKIQLKGACLHHDNGLLGAAAFPRAEERRVQIMKNNGYNAIRTSHNPPSKAFLDACDRLGMLVIDEAFDMWELSKRPNDYSNHFNEWWQKDLESMIYRDRNHPSVIMWSIGNEIQERAMVPGIETAEKLIATIRAIDNTRPVTQAICGFWDNPDLKWDDSAPAFELLDIGGYNYKREEYENDHAKYPERIMYGSESVAKEALEYWEMVNEHPYVIGDFVWTGMDYLGEAGIGHNSYKKPGDTGDIFAMPWPWYNAWCGDIDITGNKKPQSFYRDVVWGESKLEILVHEPVPKGYTELVSYWGWPAEVKSWNWEGYEGVPLEIKVYSSYPKVQLELNGEFIAEKNIGAEDRLTASFMVPYNPGELKVYGISAGDTVETRILKTSGKADKILLSAESESIIATRGELVFINLTAVDKDGNIVPNASPGMEVNVSGEGELIAAGNASPLVEGSIKDHYLTLFRGRGLIVVRPTGKAGKIILKLTSGSLQSEEIELVAK